MLAAAGFQPRAPESPLDAVMQGEAYFDRAGPLRDARRKDVGQFRFFAAVNTKAR